MNRHFVVLAVILVGLGVGLILPMNPDLLSGKERSSMNQAAPETVSFDAFSSEPPARPLGLLFIHHSCGGQLLADPGPEKGSDCIFETHPNAGGLRRMLQESGYAVREASYGSRLGGETDLFDWAPKFLGSMEEMLRCAGQDEVLAGEERNEIVCFKSCYPNNAFLSEGQPPGNPVGPELTLHNAMAAYETLLPAFRARPDVLFVCVTAPPIAPKRKPIRMWKWLSAQILGKQRDLFAEAALARRFNNWLKAKDGWLAGYEGTNVVVFDYYDVLTGHGKTDLSLHPTGQGYDSHPSRQGNEAAAKEFMPFLNRAVRRAGLSD